MHKDIRPYFDEVHAMLNPGLEKGDYTQDEIDRALRSFDPFHCMGQCTPYLTSVSQNRIIYIGPNCEEVMGISQKEVLNSSLTEIVGRLFRDVHGMVTLGPYGRMMKVLMEKYQGRYDIQINLDSVFFHEKSKSWRRLILQRKPVKWTPEGGLDLLGGLIQDITSLKTVGMPFASIVGEDQVLEYFTPDDKEVVASGMAEYSKRELDIIRMADQGLSIDEVARQTGLSKATIYSHRRNIVAKAELPDIQKVVDALKAKGII